METAISLFKEYSGQGMILTLFMISLVYLWFVEKNKEKRRLFVNFPICLLLLFFCPLVVYFMEKLAEEDVYWRMLWSIPMMAVIAYAAVLLVRTMEGVKRYLTIFGVILLIVISGNYLYDNPGFLKADNPQHMPAKVVEICDAITVEGREIRAAFPSEMLMYVTQYTSRVHMPYGREMFLRSDGVVEWNSLYELMESETVEASELAEELRAYKCHFVVLREETELIGKMETEDWLKYYETDGYVVYIDENNDPRYW